MRLGSSRYFLEGVSHETLKECLLFENTWIHFVKMGFALRRTMDLQHTQKESAGFNRRNIEEGRYMLMYYYKACVIERLAKSQIYQACRQEGQIMHSLKLPFTGEFFPSQGSLTPALKIFQ